MKKAISTIIFFIVVILFNINIYRAMNRLDVLLNIHFTVNSNMAQKYQVYFSQDGKWNEENSYSILYGEPNEERELVFLIPSGFRYLRFDFGTYASTSEISDLRVSYGDGSWELDLETLYNSEETNMVDVFMEDRTLLITSTGEEPYVIADFGNHTFHEEVGRMVRDANRVKYGWIFLIFNVGVLIFALFFNRCYEMVKEIYINRRLIWDLARNDFKTKYAGSYLGIIWAFVQPVVTVLIFWFVFQMGFRNSAVRGGFPFVLWLIAGLVPWFFFSDVLMAATNSLVDYNYLVKKVVFKISVLPMVKAISALFVHIFFIVFSLIVLSLYGIYPDIYTVQVVYYTFCIFMLSLGIVYATSAIVLFFKDLGQIVSIGLQIFNWLTPILWDYEIFTGSQIFLRLNPLFYIVEGYRDALLYKVWFWDKITLTVYFWMVTIFLFALGMYIFKRLRVHFADVI